MSPIEIIKALEDSECIWKAYQEEEEEDHQGRHAILFHTQEDHTDTFSSRFSFRPTLPRSLTSYPELRPRLMMKESNEGEVVGVRPEPAVAPSRFSIDPERFAQLQQAQHEGGQSRASGTTSPTKSHRLSLLSGALTSWMSGGEGGVGSGGAGASSSIIPSSSASTDSPSSPPLRVTPLGLNSRASIGPGTSLSGMALSKDLPGQEVDLEGSALDEAFEYFMHERGIPQGGDAWERMCKLSVEQKRTLLHFEAQSEETTRAGRSNPTSPGVNPSYASESASASWLSPSNLVKRFSMTKDLGSGMLSNLTTNPSSNPSMDPSNPTDPNVLSSSTTTSPASSLSRSSFYHMPGAYPPSLRGMNPSIHSNILSSSSSPSTPSSSTITTPYGSTIGGNPAQGVASFLGSWFGSLSSGTDQTQSTHTKHPSSPQAYAERLLASKPSQGKVLVETLRGLRVALSTARISWIQEFIEEAQGMEALKSVLEKLVTRRRSTGSMGRSESYLGEEVGASAGEVLDDAQLEVIRCLRVLLNTDSGFSSVVTQPTLITYIAYSLYTPYNRLRALVAEVLAALCVLSSDGHTLVLSALSDFGVVHEETFRFTYLVECLGGSGQGVMDQEGGEEEVEGYDEWVGAGLTLINSLVDGQETLDERVSLREELARRGMEEVIALVKARLRAQSDLAGLSNDLEQNEGDEGVIMKQIMVWEEGIQEDRRELSDRRLTQGDPMYQVSQEIRNLRTVEEVSRDPDGPPMDTYQAMGKVLYRIVQAIATQSTTTTLPHPSSSSSKGDDQENDTGYRVVDKARLELVERFAQSLSQTPTSSPIEEGKLDELHAAFCTPNTENIVGRNLMDHRAVHP